MSISLIIPNQRYNPSDTQNYRYRQLLSTPVSPPDWLIILSVSHMRTSYCQTPFVSPAYEWKTHQTHHQRRCFLRIKQTHSHLQTDQHKTETHSQNHRPTRSSGNLRCVLCTWNRRCCPRLGFLSRRSRYVYGSQLEDLSWPIQLPVRSWLYGMWCFQRRRWFIRLLAPSWRSHSLPIKTKQTSRRKFYTTLSWVQAATMLIPSDLSPISYGIIQSWRKCFWVVSMLSIWTWTTPGSYFPSGVRFLLKARRISATF